MSMKLTLATGYMKGKNALMMDILLSFPKELSFIMLAYLVQVALQICEPFLVQEIVTFLETPTAPINTGYGLLGAFFFVTLGSAVSGAMPLKTM
jgi:hypothetical protein